MLIMSRAISQSNLESSLSIPVMLVNQNFGKIFKKMQDVFIDVLKILYNAS